METREAALEAAKIIADAGGSIVGRTRLQKAAYFLEELGLGSGFKFYYKHYGPFSDDLASGVKFSELFGLVAEETKKSNWGSEYSIFSLKDKSILSESEPRKKVLNIANSSDPVALELAATAVFLRAGGAENVWNEVRRLKPEKSSTAHVELAKKIVVDMGSVDGVKPLPAF